MASNWSDTTVPSWKDECVAAVEKVRSGKQVVATVLCGAQRRDAERLVRELVSKTEGSHTRYQLVGMAREYSAEEYDFDFDDGVEVVVAQRPEFLELYSRLRGLSDRLVRRALFELLTGGSREDLARVIAAFKNAWDEGQDSAARRAPEGPTPGVNYWMMGEA